MFCLMNCIIYSAMFSYGVYLELKRTWIYIEFKYFKTSQVLWILEFSMNNIRFCLFSMGFKSITLLSSTNYYNNYC